MAIKIPQYIDQTSPQGTLDIGAYPRAQPIEDPGYIGKGIENLGNAGVMFAATVAREQSQARVVDSLKGISDDQLLWTKNLNDAITKSTDSGAGMTDRVLGDYDKYWQGKVAGVTEPALKKHLTEQYVALRNTLWHTGLTTEFKAAQNDKYTAFEETFNNLQKEVQAGTKPLDQAKKEMDTMLANSGLAIDTRNALVTNFRERLGTVGLQGEIARDPAGVERQIRSSFNTPAGNAISFVLKREGSKFVEADSNGYPVRYGINGESYPNEDIRNMTAERATEIYKRDFWDKMKLDELHAKDPKLAMAVMDTAVLAGQKRAKDMLDQSGGDVNKFLQLRSDFLNGLADSNPKKYGEYRNEWNSRTAALAQENGLTPPSPAVAQALSMIPRDKVPQWINVAQSEVHRQQATARVQVENLVNDHNTMFMQGMTVNKPLSAGDFTRAYGDIEGPQRFQAYNYNMQTGQDIQTLKTMPVAQQSGFLAERAPNPNTPNFAGQTLRYDALVKATNLVNDQRNQDPIGWAINNGVGSVGKLDMSNAESFGANLAQRVGVAKTMQGNYGSPMVLLTKAEQSSLNTAFQKMTPLEKEGYLKTIAKSVTDPEGYRAVVQQIAPDSPVTAMAGQLMGKDYMPASQGFIFKKDATMSGAQVARVMLEGEALINPNKASKEENGRGAMFPMPHDKDLREEFMSQAGDAFRGNPEAADYAFQGVKAYYAGRASQVGDYSGDLNNGGKDRVTEAVKMVLGGVSSVGSSGKVLRPWGMDEPTFNNALAGKLHEKMTEMGLANTPWDRVDTYRWQNFRDGQYLIQNNNDFIRGPDGKPVVIDIREAPTAQGQPWKVSGLEIARKPEINQVIGNLTEAERNIVKYHEKNLLNGTSGRDEQGRPITVFSTTIQIPEGEKGAGKFVTVPGYVVDQPKTQGYYLPDIGLRMGGPGQPAITFGKPNNPEPPKPTGQILNSDADLYARWKGQIQAGEWPIYASSEMANQRAQLIHQVMDYDAGNPSTPGAALPAIPMRAGKVQSLPTGKGAPRK